MRKDLLQSKLKLFEVPAILIFGLCLIFPELTSGQDTQVASAEFLTGATISENRQLLYYAPLDVDEENRQALNKIISFNINGISMEEALQQIADRGNLRLSYSIDVSLMNWDEPVSLQSKEATVLGALYAVLSDTDLRLKITPKGLLIVHKDSQLQVDENVVHIEYGELEQEAITGRVIDAISNESIPGVNILVQGTTTGTTTNIDGTFELTVADYQQTIVVSYIGYLTQIIPLDGRIEVNVRLQPAVTGLDEVVVTAFGVERERRALGYTVTPIEGGSLTQAREVNAVTSLVGRVAGVNVHSIAGGPGSSANIQIRGMSSLSQSNQPLYVINGIPMTNETSTGRGSHHSGPDRGDNIGSINPDDIESISVLKGAAAAALYGSLAKAGAIIITTKSGQANQPVSVEFNSNIVVSQVVDLTDFQYEYGQGLTAYVDGEIVHSRPITANEAVATGNRSWGPVIDGQSTIQADGVMRPYTAVPNSITDFYQTGWTGTNTVAVSKGFDQGSVRFSVSNLDNINVMPNSGMDRQTFDLSTNFNIIDGLQIDARANYTVQHDKNRARLADIAGNINNAILLYATTLDLNDFKDVVVNEQGNEFPLHSSVFTANPWFNAKHYQNNTDQNRLRSSIKLRYDFQEYFIQGSAGINSYRDRFKEVRPTGTASNPSGNLTEQVSNFDENYFDLMAGKAFQINEDIIISPNLGTSLRRINTENFNTGGSGFAIPYVYYLGNVPNRNVSYGLSENEMQSVYGIVELNYRDIFYLTGTGRNDWFSTLANTSNTNSVDKFYPSISGSFVFSELIDDFDWLSFGKLRAGYAQVGQATSPYQTGLTYSTSSDLLGDMQRGNISGSTVPNSALRPSTASELEIGTDLSFFNGRLSLDLTWYKKISSDEIINSPISGTSGYSSASLNIGEIENQGWEALISLSPVQSDAGLNWITSLNGTINNNKILSLADEVSTVVWATARRGPAFIQHIVGLPAGQVMAFDFERNEDGTVQINPQTGFPNPASELSAFGSAYHKWLAGWSNQFNYKNVNLGFQIDGKFGGKIYSNTASEAYTTGKNKDTLVGRDQIWGNNLSAQDYYQHLAGNVSALFVEDASFIKLRQITLGYNIPGSNFNNVFRNLNISLVGRNILFLMKKTTNIDPESAYTGAAQGLEMGSLPSQRTYGVNLNITF